MLVLISKPPADEVVQLILNQVSASGKPTVICFLGGDMAALTGIPNVIPARTLYECALLAAQAGDIKSIVEAENASSPSRPKSSEKTEYQSTLSARTVLRRDAVLRSAGDLEGNAGCPVYSNAPLPGGSALPDSTKSYQHTAVDLGEEEFTVGRPHPMIDNDLRIRRLLQEARDPKWLSSCWTWSSATVRIPIR